MKLEQKRAEQDLPRREGGQKPSESRGRMPQTMYTNRNKLISNKKIKNPFLTYTSFLHPMNYPISFKRST
jgi:hypothetical protein